MLLTQVVSTVKKAIQIFDCAFTTWDLVMLIHDPRFSTQINIVIP